LETPFENMKGVVLKSRPYLCGDAWRLQRFDGSKENGLRQETERADSDRSGRGLRGKRNDEIGPDGKSISGIGHIKEEKKVKKEEESSSFAEQRGEWTTAGVRKSRGGITILIRRENLLIS